MHVNPGDALSECTGAVRGVCEKRHVGNELYSLMRTTSVKCVFGVKNPIPLFCMRTHFELGWKAGRIYEENKEQKHTAATSGLV